MHVLNINQSNLPKEKICYNAVSYALGMDSDATPEKLYPDIADAGEASPVLAAEDAKRKELELELANV